MKSLSGVSLFLLIHALLLVPQAAYALPAPSAVQPETSSAPAPSDWNSQAAKHVYGLPEAKPNEKGTLTLSAHDFTFTGKASRVTIPRQSIIAVSAGNQRVEIWGMKGRILRMVIPDGGGAAAALFMHHRVDMLTVEFADTHGGYHGAVFFLPAKEADGALESFSRTPPVPRDAVTAVCHDGVVRPHSVLLQAPVWQQAEVPAAYRALVYERLYDRLRQVKGMDHVYRDGENYAQQGCPQYSMQIAVSGFKEGNQAKRAMLGPVGMFVGTTQMKFDANVTDASGNAAMHEQIKATVRGETESTNVAGDVAKKLSKDYAAMLKKAGDKDPLVPASVTRQP